MSGKIYKVTSIRRDIEGKSEDLWRHAECFNTRDEAKKFADRNSDWGNDYFVTEYCEKYSWDRDTLEVLKKNGKN